MEKKFYICESNVHGKGLYSRSFIPKNTLFDVDVSRPRKSDYTYSNDTYILDYYLCGDESVHCIQGGCVKKVSALNNISEDAFVPRYVTCTHISMIANDLAWPATSEEEYETHAYKNKICLLLELSSKCKNNFITSVKVCVTQDIYENEEVGNSYGYGFWVAQQIV